MFALGAVVFGELVPVPVVFGAAPPAAGALGLPGAVAPGLPPAPPVCANAAVVISSADIIATGINVLADILRLLLCLAECYEGHPRQGAIRRAGGLFRTAPMVRCRERAEAHLNRNYANCVAQELRC